MTICPNKIDRTMEKETIIWLDPFNDEWAVTLWDHQGIVGYSSWGVDEMRKKSRGIEGWIKATGIGEE